MLNWVNTHGIEALIIAFVFASVISTIPPLPPNTGWWATWLYKTLQLLGASLDKAINSTPQGKKLESLRTVQTNDGTLISTESVSQSETIIPSTTTKG